ncbi:DUF3291 domain-containing protein [Lentiprolixibacter aurantiacus]|uniref:DUF3291 domain-containing protein n=1 Tax=Lentiprolixibacter aurantiacus TaxID=2993939 RepID=A0AAE3SNY5_9FLAO|nr:DUF3291 domain-containing protein [Lentiprolixibacter aurantiacus]MCX2720134.1 DUF3291 domain-containing protein [Lentiprolixibacter aurantiacus]
MEPITTISFFRYSSFWSKVWAFSMMQFAHPSLGKVKGLRFYKLMGSGKAGFNPWPDWSVYALVQVWDSPGDAEAFFNGDPLMKKYRGKVAENMTLYLKTLKVKGEWSGQNPFPKNQDLDPENKYMAVITRATIKTKFLYRFWKYVPQSQKSLMENEGLLYTKGIGEVPFRNMATFSIWKDRESLQAFAYNATGHKKAIAFTHTLKWYKEELFARFQPYKVEGSWSGIPPMELHAQA